MTMQKHVFAASLLLTCTANAIDGFEVHEKKSVIPEATDDSALSPRRLLDSTSYMQMRMEAEDNWTTVIQDWNAKGEWTTDFNCRRAASGTRATVFKEPRDEYDLLGYDLVEQWNEQFLKAECAYACDITDDCVYAELHFWTQETNPGDLGASCFLLAKCEEGDEERHQFGHWEIYIRGELPVPTPTPTPASEPSGDWITATKCSNAPIHRTLVFNKWDDTVTERQYKAECMSACDEEDSCVAAEFYFTLPTVTRCWLLDECDIDEQEYWMLPYQLYVKGGADLPTPSPTDAPVSEPSEFPDTPSPTFVPTPGPTNAPTALPTPAPTNAPTSPPTSEPTCEDLTVQTNMLVSIKKGKKHKKTMKLEDEDSYCECAELCQTAGYDIFQYYSKTKRGKVKTSCQCMNLTNKVKAKTKKGHTAGALTSAAEEEFSKFQGVKKSKKDQKAGL